MYKILIIVLFVLSANASNLTLIDGQIKAHTEVFIDKDINPVSKQIESDLKMDNNLNSIRGNISISALSLKSNNERRDKDMYETINAKTHPYIKFNIKDIMQSGKTYKINGELTLNGVSKDVSSSAVITDEQGIVNISGEFSLNLTDYNIVPPTLLFFEVRNQTDITYTLSYEKNN